MWGGYGHATGVDTLVGKSKMELWTDNILRRFGEMKGRVPDPKSRSDIDDMRELQRKIMKEDEHAALTNSALGLA